MRCSCCYFNPVAIRIDNDAFVIAFACAARAVKNLIPIIFDPLRQLIDQLL